MVRCGMDPKGNAHILTVISETYQLVLVHVPIYLN